MSNEQKLVWYFRLDAKIVACNPKAGSNTIRRAMGVLDRAPMSEEYVTAHTEVPLVMFVRHPYERLRGVWAYFHPLDQPFPAGLPQGMEWTTFINAVLNGKMDHHWHPQMEGLAREPDQVYRFEDIAYWWPKVFPPGTPLRHLNPSRYPKPEDDYKRDEIERRYWLDMNKWIEAKRPEEEGEVE